LDQRDITVAGTDLNSRAVFDYLSFHASKCRWGLGFLCQNIPLWQMVRKYMKDYYLEY
jgi:hypothetical protein